MEKDPLTEFIAKLLGEPHKMHMVPFRKRKNNNHIRTDRKIRRKVFFDAIALLKVMGIQHEAFESTMHIRVIWGRK